ncbi:hypothetical protein LTR78_006455 [Recurvomyces mirabilis]|uniref:Glutathione S-transferase n=1 Tax=Recurvomyces mirabilis TaxID=574656 RepID=A0AAE1BZR4_9PEZI|nr:hypothetical protein LTR78_006455 [Recurvomyces mirabilis]KAK5151125.1 hypothetical protein LTS14_009621 [Recurvomyces mirabilis]
MVLTVHHLGISQSKRILWLLEELGIQYELVKHVRAPALAPQSLMNVPGNATGKAPFVADSDTGVTLSESGAICEYIIHRYGSGKFAIPPTADAKTYAAYLYWLHFSNGTLQAAMVNSMFTRPMADTHFAKSANKRLEDAVQVMDDRLAETKWLAGSEFTAADVMSVYPVTTQRYFGPQMDFTPYKNVLRWLKDCGARPAYQKAMEKGDPEMRLLLGGEAPSESILVSGGVNSKGWRKA